MTALTFDLASEMPSYASIAERLTEVHQASLCTLMTLVVQQPFATLIAYRRLLAVQRGEPTDYRGTVVIVSGRNYSKSPRARDFAGIDGPRGCAVAVGSLVGCRRSAEGWGWVLHLVQPIRTPIPASIEPGLVPASDLLRAELIAQRAL